MSLPKSVQAQADAAQAHFNKPENPDDETVSTPEQEAAETQDAVQPEDTAKKTAEDDKPEQKPEPKEPERSASYWENRFNVINGKYAAEVPTLHNEIKTLKQQKQSLEEQLQSLKDQQAKSSESPFSDEQLAEFKEAFGEDVVSFVERMVDAKSGPSGEVEDLRAKVAQMEQRDQQSQESLFWTALDELVPGWKAVNDDPAFHRYLAQYDPQSGVQRQQVLVDAQRALDADGVAQLFNGFKQEATPKPSIPDEDVEIERSRATTAPKGEKLWSRADISQFYRDKASGRFDAKEAERLEADIFAAQRQGRVR